MGGTRGRAPAWHYVALAGIVTLLALLCCYFLYFCIRRIKELSSQPLPEPVKSVRPPPRPAAAPAAYPVQPGVRESATAMARLCQLPAHTDTVFPGARSPAPRSPAPRSPRSPAGRPPPARATSLPSPRIVSTPQSRVAKQTD